MSPENIQSSPEQHRLTEVLQFEINEALLEQLADFKRGEPLGWGATPLEPHHPDIKGQQESVRRHIVDMFDDAPDWATPEFATMMSNANQARLFHRQSRNHDNFGHRVQWDLNETPALLQETQYRALTGNASPAEIIVSATQLGVPAYELTSLTRPYGHDFKEPLAEMREQNKKAILFAGGIYFDDPAVKFAVKRGNYFHSGDNPADEDKSLLITRTKTIGQLDAATRCFERSSFILKLTDDLFEQVKDIPYDSDWSKKIEDIPGFIDYIVELLEDDVYDVAVPSSVTTFVVNDRLVKSQIKDEDTYRERSRLMTNTAAETGGLQAITLPAGTGMDSLRSRISAAAQRLTQRF